MDAKTIAITGADGFVGKNLVLRSLETGRYKTLPIVRNTDAQGWNAAIRRADCVVHLAGVNRPKEPADFVGNCDAARALAGALSGGERPGRIIMLSSTQAELDNPYGASKRQAEAILTAASKEAQVPLAILRAPNIFGKWSRPNYNSAVATFCHNAARGLPIKIHDRASPMRLLHIDDLVTCLFDLIEVPEAINGFFDAAPIYTTTVGEVADAILGFAEDRENALIGEVGSGLNRALYATYISHLPVESFCYELVSHSDPRGSFSEMLKTRGSGQFSYFNAKPGVTRGGHYHHTKTEKFLVVHGRARFRFRHVLTGEQVQFETSAERPVVVETIPGWAHDITNIGDEVMVSLLWANEIFDRERPDTIAAQVL